jgi:hypothetical protein
MSENPGGAVNAGPSHRSVEVGVAIATLLFALIVIYGSLQAGIDWGLEGPRAGFFPFYIGVLILGGSAVNLVQVFGGLAKGGIFADWAQLRQVLAVVIPAAIYVAIVPFLGIYVASTFLIAVFMKWLGRYKWGLVLAVAIGMPIVTFVVFEHWFLVPLPKGPIEEFLGF